MKTNLLFCITLFLCNALYSQLVPSVIFQDNFDSYTAGAGITTQTTNWRTFSNVVGGSEDAMITSAFSNSSPNSLNIINNDDIIYNFANKTTGIYSAEFKMLVKSGKGGYLTVLHDRSTTLGFELYFKENKQILFENGAVSNQLATFNNDEWFTLNLLFNLTKDSLYIYKDGAKVGSYVFSLSIGAAAKKVLGCIDFFGLSNYAAYNINNSDFLIDNFVFAEMIPAPAAPTNAFLGNTMIPTIVKQGTIIGTLTAQDINIKDTHTFQLVSGYGDNAIFTITNKNLTATNDINLSAPKDFNIRILVTDNTGLSKEVDFVIHANTNDYFIQNLNLQDVDEISMVDKNTIWVESQSGQIGRTIDGGVHWEIVYQPAAVNTTGPFCAVDSLTAWVLISWGTNPAPGILKTNDGGKTWVTQTTAYNSSSFPDLIYFWNKNEGFTMGDADNLGYLEIYTTQNGGENWTRVAQDKVPSNITYTVNTLKVMSVFQDTIWICGELGYIHRSCDKGKTWSSFRSLPADAPRGSVFFVNGRNGIYSAFSNTYKNMYTTTNGGVSWELLNTNVTNKGYYQNFCMIPGTEIIAMADLNSLYFSDNKGVSWVKTENDFPQLLKIAFFDERLGWAGGFNGQVYKIFRNNTDPVRSSLIADKVTFSEKALNYSIPAGTFTDANNDPISYIAALANGGSLPAWLQFNPATQTFTGTPAIENVGTYQLAIKATDNYNAFAYDTFNLEVLFYHAMDEEVIQEQIIVVTNDQSISLTIPDTIFKEAELEGPITYTVTLLNGDPLPSWITYVLRPLKITILKDHKKNFSASIIQILIKATDENGKNAFLEMTFDASTVGVKFKFIRDVLIYPNPAKDHLFIKAPDYMISHQIRISDATGRVLYKNTFETNEVFHDIDISHYRRGLYIIELITGDGIFKSRVIIE